MRFLSIEPLLEDLGTLDLRGIHWVIVGGESGKGARPMSRTWVLSIRDLHREEGRGFNADDFYQFKRGRRERGMVPTA